MQWCIIQQSFVFHAGPSKAIKCSEELNATKAFNVSKRRVYTHQLPRVPTPLLEEKGSFLCSPSCLLPILKVGEGLQGSVLGRTALPCPSRGALLQRRLRSNLLGSAQTGGSQATWQEGDMRALGTRRRRSLFPRAKNVTQMGFRP